MVAVFWLKTPPPSCAELPVKVLVVSVSTPLLLIAPPDVPLSAGDESLLNVLPVTERVPWLKIAPPPSTPLLARPWLSVSDVSVRWPAEATSKMRKLAVPDTVDRAIVAPLPATVTLPVMTGRPVPPSVVLFLAVSVYTHPLVSVTVPDVLFAVLMAAIRLVALQAVAASAGEATAKLASTGAATAAVATRRRK